MNLNATQSLRKLGNTFFLFKKNSIIPFHFQTRNITFMWEWLYAVFNTVDQERLNLVGPDFACAEWLLRNGATVRFKGYSHFITDYHDVISLETIPESTSHFRVEEIFAEEAGLHHHGFEHFKNCNHISKISLILCHYVNDTALYKLNYLSNSLEHLELRSCFNVTDKGLLYLTKLRNLKELFLENLASVKNEKHCVSVLQKSLVNCNINYQK